VLVASPIFLGYDATALSNLFIVNAVEKVNRPMHQRQRIIARKQRSDPTDTRWSTWLIVQPLPIIVHSCGQKQKLQYELMLYNRAVTRYADNHRAVTIGGFRGPCAMPPFWTKCQKVMPFTSALLNCKLV